MSLKSRSGAPLSVIREDVVAGHDPLITVVSAKAAVINLIPTTAYELGRLLIDAAGDDGCREALISAGTLSPGARSMPLAAAIAQHNEANALGPDHPDYLQPPATVSLADAVDLLPEAWHDELAADAAGQGCTLSYTAAAGGLRTATIVNIQRHYAERGDDADWQELSDGQRLDECFPQYCGIGALDLLDELGVVTVYHRQSH